MCYRTGRCRRQCRLVHNWAGHADGNPIAPVIKISTNSNLAQRMPDIIDIDAGGIISGEKTIEQMGE